MPARSALGEFGRIARFFAPLASDPSALGLTDDAAVLTTSPDSSIVVTADAMVEGVHFLGTEPPGLIARKLLRVNLSDLSAMGAAPLGYFLTMALPARCGDDWLDGFAAGLRADQEEFAFSLLGGDSVSTPGPVTLSVTMLGTVPKGEAVRRSGAKPGDALYVSGTIGDGALGLMGARGELPRLGRDHRSALVARYEMPLPRLAIGQALRGVAHAMLDVSDGLVADLGHIAETSGVSAVLQSELVPLSPAAAAALETEPSLLARVLTGGDDYELLFTAPEDRASEIRQIGANAKLFLTRIGHIEAGRGVRVLNSEGQPMPLKVSGWTHA